MIPTFTPSNHCVTMATGGDEKVAQAYGQISFFNEAEHERTLLAPEPEIKEVIIPKYTRKKKT